MARTSREQLRWGTTVPDSVDEARERIVDAAEGCILRFGVLKTTVEDVASAANISRATVYRYFDNRDAIVLAVLLRASDRNEIRIWRKIAGVRGHAERLVEGFIATLRSIPQDPMLGLLFGGDSALEMASLVGASEAFTARLIDRVVPFLEDAARAGVLREGVDYRDAAEWIERVLMSFLTVPAAVRRSDAQVRRMLQTYLVPVLFYAERRRAAVPGGSRAS